MKKCWRIFKEIINKKKQSKSCSQFQLNGTKTTVNITLQTDSTFLFINVAPNLASKIPSDSRCPTSYMSKRVTNDMLLTPVIEEGTTNIMKSLKDSSSGWDEIYADVVKTTNSTFIKPLTHIMNQSLATGFYSGKI